MYCISVTYNKIKKKNKNNVFFLLYISKKIVFLLREIIKQTNKQKK